MSRFYNKISNDDSLEKLFYQLVDQAIYTEIIETNTLSYDSTKLESYERAKPKMKFDKDDYSTSDWGAKYDTHRNKITWFGWKTHLVSDVKGELPLDFAVTPANEADCEQALTLVSRVTKRHKSRKYQIPEY